MRKMTKRLLGLGAAVALAAGGTGIAYAAGWFVFGTVNVEANAAVVQPLAVIATIDPMDELYPNGAVDVNLLIDNTANNFPVSVTSIEKLLITVDNVAMSLGCTADMVDFAAPAGALPIAALGTAPVVGSLTMDPDASAGCQGARFTLHLRANATVG